MHRAQSQGGNPMVRLGSLRSGYRPFSGSKGGHSANNWQKMLDHDRYSNDKHIHARLYPWGIQRTAHEDGNLPSQGGIELQSLGYRHQWQELGWPRI